MLRPTWHWLFAAPTAFCGAHDRVTRRISLPANTGYKVDMSGFLSHGLVPVAIGAVAVVLLLGLVNMMRGGSPNTSQKLMRLRVLLQFVAIVIIMFTIWIIAK
jgi:Hypoxia induced protein conserved region